MVKRNRKGKVDVRFSWFNCHVLYAFNVVHTVLLLLVPVLYVVYGEITICEVFYISDTE